MKRKKLLLGTIMLILLTGCAANSTSNNADSVETSVITETSFISTENTETTETETSQSTADTTTIMESTTTATTTTAAITTVPEVIPNDGQLVRIIDYIPDAFIDLRYATTNNFTGTVLYDDSNAYLCYGTVKKLMQVQEDLKEKGYSILIWDAYRSPEAQQRLWEVYPDPNFVADPRNGLTSHSRGSTIDIAIVNQDGSPVELPSEFDEFTAVADRDYSDVSEEAAANARLLEEVMYNNGFTGYIGEWWDYSDTETYTLEVFKQVTSNNDIELLTEFLQSSNYSYSDIEDSSQLIIVNSEGSNCETYCYEKNDDIWTLISDSRGILGKNGVTDDKHEGDGCTPQGLYTLGFGFGTDYIDTQLEYRIINNNCYWVDDADSEYYNQWVETTDIEWNSAEHLIDYTESYRYGVVINYNTDPVIPNAGSAIFLHCSSGNYTAGCVAVSEENMKNIIQWLSPDKNPVIIIE